MPDQKTPKGKRGDSTKSPGKFVRRVSRRIGFLLVAVTLLGAIYLSWRLLSRSDVRLATDAEVASAIPPMLRAAGGKAGSKKAWDVFQGAVTSLRGDFKDPYHLPWKASEMGAAKNFVATNAPAIAQLRIALSLGPGYREPGGLQVDRAKDLAIFELLRFLRIRVQLHCQQKDRARAFDDLILWFDLISFLRHSDAGAFAFRTSRLRVYQLAVVEQALRTFHFSEPELERLTKSVLASEATEDADFQRTVARNFNDAFVPLIRNPDVIQRQLAAEFATEVSFKGGNLDVLRTVSEGGAAEVEMVKSLRLPGGTKPLPINLALEKRAEQCPGPPSKAHSDSFWDQLTYRISKEHFYLWLHGTPNSLGLIGCLSNLLSFTDTNLEREHRVVLTLVKLRLGIERFVRRFGRRPANLADLVKAGIQKNEPMDSYSGGPFFYFPGKGLLYSVGRDGTDDGGATRYGSGRGVDLAYNFGP